MRDMLKAMTGEGKGKGKSQKPGDKPNTGSTSPEGTSDLANNKVSGSASNTKEERLVPKTTSIPSKDLPKEDARALDAYNKTVKK